MAMTMTVIFGCNSINLNINFQHINGLTKGADVIFDGTTIGTVKSITYTTQGDFLAVVAIQKEFSTALTNHARFYIAPFPSQADKKAIIMILAQRGGQLLKNGATLKGALPPVTPKEQNPVIESIESGLEQFIADLKKIPQSEQYQSFEKKIDELAKEMQASGEAVQDKIRNEIIPQIIEELEKLRKQFEDFGKEEDVAPLEDKLNNLKEL